MTADSTTEVLVGMDILDCFESVLLTVLICFVMWFVWVSYKEQSLLEVFQAVSVCAELLIDKPS